MNRRHRYGAVVAVVSAGLVAGTVAMADEPECTVVVQPGDSLQQAITESSAGDVLCLAPGEWEENVRVEKPITLRGSGKGETVIRAADPEMPVVHITAAFGQEAPQVTIADLALGAPDGRHSTGLLVDDEVELLLSGSKVSRSEGAGIVLRGAAQASVRGCIVKENADGIWVRDTAQVTITESDIVDNTDGIWVNHYAVVTVADSTVGGNLWGMVISDWTEVTLEATDIAGNEWAGLTVAGSARTVIEGCVVSGNHDGVLLKDSAHVRITDTDLADNERLAVALWEEPCLEADEEFTGLLEGGGNHIPGGADSVCPEELEFLSTEEGGELDRR